MSLRIIMVVEQNEEMRLDLWIVMHIIIRYTSGGQKLCDTGAEQQGFDIGSKLSFENLKTRVPKFRKGSEKFRFGTFRNFPKSLDTKGKTTRHNMVRNIQDIRAKFKNSYTKTPDTKGKIVRCNMIPNMLYI